MREAHDFLTDATRDGLTDNVKAAAFGWDKALSYIYGILTGEKKDPFAMFRSFYTGLCKGGVSTASWDNDLAYIREKYAGGSSSPAKCPTVAFQSKFESHNDIFAKYLAAIADGKLTVDEVNELEGLLDTDDQIKKGLREALTAHKVRLGRENTR